MQRALIQYKEPSNYELVKEALIKEKDRTLSDLEADALFRQEKLSIIKEKISFPFNIFWLKKTLQAIKYIIY